MLSILHHYTHGDCVDDHALCFAMLSGLYFATCMLCYVLPSCANLFCRAMLRNVQLKYVVLCCAMLCNVVLCCAMSCYVGRCHAMFCYIVLCSLMKLK